MMRFRSAWVLSAPLLLELLTGCGGAGTNPSASGGSGSGSGDGTPPPQLSITTTTLPLALVGSPYAGQLTAVNGSGTLTWNASSSITSTTPAGLTLSSDGLLSGTPTASSCGPSLTVTVKDSSTPAQTASATFQYDAAGFNEELLQGQVGVFYDNVIQFECSTNPISWSLISGSLPPGLQMMPFSPGSSQLNFWGTPTQSGVFSLKVQAQDGSNRTAQQSASMTILPSALVITDSVMQLGVVNQTFDHILKTTGGTPPYSFSLSSGSLATGLQLNLNTGEISGIPTTPGFYQFNISVTDRTSPTAFSFTKPYTILVTPAILSPRNDSLTTATPIFPGTYTASLSPYADTSGNAAPDHDYYSLIVNGGDIYAIGAVTSYNLGTSATNPGAMTSSADPAIEILDSTGTRMTTCNDPIADNPPPGAPITKGAGTFSDACVDHGGDQIGGQSRLTVSIGQGLNQTIYIHVFDFRGRARPDFIYTLGVTKTN